MGFRMATPEETKKLFGKGLVMPVPRQLASSLKNSQGSAPKPETEPGSERPEPEPEPDQETKPE